jgi:ATP-dependent DNA helicase DinG
MATNHTKRIRAVLGPQGVLARTMEGYEHRTQQVQMAIEVSDALESGERLVIEAPTGTGKTLAYLVAAALSRKRVVISTGTKNLQEQLFEKDIPFLRSKVFPGLKAALLKGRGNFICHHRLMRFLRQPFLEGMRPHSLDEILAWYRKQGTNGTGDRAELDNLADDDPVWPEICSTSETCVGKKCPDRDDCFVQRMKARAADADIMVVNHHLLAADLAVRDSGFGEVIPRYEAAIIDEAHGLEDALTQHFGLHLTFARIARFVNDVRWELRQQQIRASTIDSLLANLEERARRLFQEFLQLPVQRAALGAVTRRQVEVREAVSTQLTALASALGSLPQHSEELETLGDRARLIGFDLSTIISDERDDEYARWVERRDRSVMLHASPVEVGHIIREKLYEQVSSAVFTSATLSTDGDFAYFESRLGLDADPRPRESILDSPFDHACQTMLYIPKQLPEPNSQGFIDAVVPVLEDLLIKTGGRAFLLFTSHRNMVAVYERMQGRLPFPMLIQGSRPKSRLLEEFKELHGSVLFATASFWEGVDVRGEALSCVVVDRLPFAPPDDPIVAARVERIKKVGGESFYSFQVPMAVIALKQGLGRLIRTRSDRGVLCILDTRIVTKQYGKVFRRSLYQSPIHRDTGHIEDFFRQTDKNESSLRAISGRRDGG